MLPVAVIVVLLALSSLTSIRIANNMLNVGTEISDNYSKSLVLLGDISEKFESLNSIIYKHCISTDDSVKSSLVQNYKTRTKEISNLCTQFEKTLDAGQEEDNFNEFKTNYDKYLKDFNTALNASTAGQGTLAAEMANNALFTQLSLPGSKNSFAYRVDAGYDPQTGLSKFYQALPPLGINATVETTTQFDEGIRVFDVHLNIDRRTPVVYAGGANVSPQITLEAVLNTLRDKVNPNNETASECAVVFLNYVNDGYTVSEWLPMVMDALDSWNSSNGGILTTLDQNTTMGDVRGKVAVIINLQTSDRPTGSAPVNYINKFSTSVQNTSIVSAPYSSGATVRIQNLQQCNNPEITSGETPYVYKGEGIGLVPYFITREDKLYGASFDLIETKRDLMKELNSEIAQGGQNLYINDLSGFCVTKNASSTGYLTYTEYECNEHGWGLTWYEWDETGKSGTIYDYNNFPLDESVYTNTATGAGTSWTVESRPGASSDYEGKLWLNGTGYDLGNGGNTCLFAELFNGEAVAEYSSLIGDLRQPLGIVLMNFAGVATVNASNRSYAVQGIRLPGLIMMNNFMFPLKTGTTTTRTSSDTSYSKEGNVWD